MPFLTGLALITLAPSWAAQSFNFAADARLDALGWAGLAALMAVMAVLGRAAHRAVSRKRRRSVDARLAALAEPRRRWLAPSAAFDPAPRVEPQMRRVQLRSSAPSEISPAPAAAPVVAQVPCAAPEPAPQAQPHQRQTLRVSATQDISATLIAAPESPPVPPAAPEPAVQAISVPAPEAAQAPPAAPKPVPQDLPPTREQLFVRAMRVPVVPVPLPKHVQEARLAGLMAPPPVIAPEVAPARSAAPEPAAQAISCPAPEAAPTPSAAPKPVPQELPPARSPLYAELRAPVVPVLLPKHVQEARLAGLMAPPLAAPAPTPRPAQPKHAYVPASPTFAGGHVLASGLDARVFLRYRDAAGAVTDSIFQVYQVRASRAGGFIEQLHGHCFTAGAFRVVPMRDVGAVGDERTGHFVFDLDAFLLGRPVRPNPFGYSLTPRGKYISDPRLPLDGLAAKWQHWQGLLYAAVAQALRSPGVPHATPRPAADAGPRFLLRYIASDNAVSDRIVQLQAVSAAGDGTVLSIAAYCERAEATRTFLRHRIVALGDAATGALRDDIDAALRGPGARVHSFGPVPARSVGKAGLPEAMEQARQAFAAMPAAERLASATRPVEPTPLKEKRPRGRPRKNAVPPPE